MSISVVVSLLLLIIEANAFQTHCATSLCITRCCKNNYHLLNFTCVANKQAEDKVFVYSEDLKSVLDVNVIGVYDYNLEMKDFTQFARPKTPILLKNGNLRYLDTKGNSMFVTPDNFCIGHRKTSKRGNLTVRYMRRVNIPTTFSFMDIFKPVGWLISSVCLSLVLLVYGLLKELRNLRGLMVMSCLASLMTAYALLTVFSISSLLNSRYIVLQKVCAHLIYFSILTCFFWMNTMSFDIWWTFRGMVLIRAIHRRGELCKYFVYSTYAWGVPMLMTVTIIILDRVHLPDTFPKPGLMDGGFFKGKPLQYFLLMPLMIILLVNIVLFAMTVYNISQVKVDSTRLSRKVNNNKNRFSLYLKLFVVMGLNWALEYLSAKLSLEKYYFAAIYNTLIGVVIFFIFVCNRSTWKKLSERYLGKVPRWSYRSGTRSGSFTDDSNLGQNDGIALQVNNDARGSDTSMPAPQTTDHTKELQTLLETNKRVNPSSLKNPSMVSRNNNNNNNNCSLSNGGTCLSS